MRVWTGAADVDVALAESGKDGDDVDSEFHLHGAVHLSGRFLVDAAVRPQQHQRTDNRDRWTGLL